MVKPRPFAGGNLSTPALEYSCDGPFCKNTVTLSKHTYDPKYCSIDCEDWHIISKTKSDEEQK
jgi:hypothetical protein